MSGQHVEDVLVERGRRYGRYDNVSRVAQALKRELRCGASWHALSDAQRESLEMIANKLARIVNAPDPGYVDSWTDVAGYAQLVVDEIGRRWPEETDDEDERG